MLARAADIQRLAQQLDKIRGFRADVGQREQESQLIKEQVAALVKELDPAWTLQDLDRFQTSLARRTIVDEMQQQWETLENQRRDLSAQRPNLVADIEAMQHRLDEIAGTLVPRATRATGRRGCGMARDTKRDSKN